MKNNPRALAVEALTRVLNNKAYSNIEINNILKSSELSDPDARLMTNIVYGVLQNKIILEYQLEPYIEDKKLDNWVKNLLLSAVYQLHFLDKVPDHAVLNESVEIAKINGNQGLGNLVTAVLRNYQRHGFTKLPKKNNSRDMSIRYSTPEWLVDLLIKQQGVSKAELALDSINSPSNISLRVNTNKTNVNDVVSDLSKEGFDAKPSELSEYGVVLSGGNLANTKGFRSGLYTIQDESSMLVAPALEIKPDDKVLDACAAPGGKTTHIASFLKTGTVTALDIHKNKTKLIRENAERLGYQDIVETGAMDARKAKDVFDNQTFDKILVDAPCSGLGLIRRKPELRYFREPGDLLDLQRIQLQILDSVSDLLKVNGRMVFSTCTFDNEENEDVVTQFLTEHPNYELAQITNDKLSSSIHNGMLKILPNDYYTDGFFIAALKRKK